MKKVKRWAFLWMLAAMGAVFFTVTGTWDVMGKPYFQAKEWIQGLRQAEACFPWEPGWDKFISGASGDGTGGLESSGYNSGGTVTDPDGGIVAGGAGVSGNGTDGAAGGGTAGSGTGGNGTDGNDGGGGTDGSGTDGSDGGSGTAGSGTAGSGTAGSGTAGSGMNGNDGGGGAVTDDGTGPRNPEDVVYANVDDGYFSDAVFIGDSRTVGMFEYGGLEEISTFYASKGLTVYSIFDSPIVTVPGQKQKQTIEEALQQKQFSKIYLMIGINEMGRGTVETFIEKYREVVGHLQELQPDAVIYLQGILRVTTERSGQGDYITNEGIEVRNAEIAKLADYRRVYYLDVNPLICDETGGMEPSYTFDGVHLKAQYIPIWKEFLKQRAVVLD